MATDSNSATLRQLQQELHESTREQRQLAPIDAAVDIITPENIAFEYRVAGPFRRMLAYAIDIAIRVIVLIIFGILLVFGMQFLGMAGLLGSMMSAGLLLQATVALIWFLGEVFYGGIFETFWNGQTPGKRMLSMRVLTVDGRPINGLQAVLRNILRYVEWTPIVIIPYVVSGSTLPIDPSASSAGFAMMLYAMPLMMLPLILGIVPMMLNRRYQRIGDLVCGTMVVIEERSWLMGVSKLEDARTPKLAEYLPPKFEVSRSLARALAAYVERRRHIPVARRREIARHLGEPLVRQFELPSDTSHDLLLCALYYKTFIADRESDDRQGHIETTPAVHQPPYAATYGGQYPQNPEPYPPQAAPQTPPDGITWVAGGTPDQNQWGGPAPGR